VGGRGPLHHLHVSLDGLGHEPQVRLALRDAVQDKGVAGAGLQELLVGAERGRPLLQTVVRLRHVAARGRIVGELFQGALVLTKGFVPGILKRVALCARHGGIKGRFIARHDPPPVPAGSPTRDADRQLSARWP